MENTLNPACAPDPACTVDTRDARAWTQILARYREPSRGRSLVEIIITAGAFALLWASMWAALYLGYWLCLLLALPTAGFLVRLFMIQHDCGHGAFFRHRLANDWVGRVIGVLTLTPYDLWRQTHAIHHATSGNLDRRGIGDIDTLTVREYLALSRWAGSVIAFIATRSSCSVSGPLICSSCSIGCRCGMMRGGMAALAQHHGNQRGDRGSGRRDDMARRRRAIPARALAHHAAGSLDRRLAVLRPAPVRGHILGQRKRLEPAGGGAARKLALRPAGDTALVYRQHRRASRASFVQPDSVLPVAAGSARLSRARPRGSADARRERSLRPPRACGTKISSDWSPSGSCAAAGQRWKPAAPDAGNKRVRAAVPSVGLARSLAASARACTKSYGTRSRPCICRPSATFRACFPG